MIFFGPPGQWTFWPEATLFVRILVGSFIIWPAAAIWAAKRNQLIVVWIATGMYLALTFLFNYLQHLVFGGLLMLAAAVWQTSKN